MMVTARTSRSHPVSRDHALELLATHYGLSGDAQRLPSEVDDTFRINATDGRRYTFKVASPDDRLDRLMFQVGALQHLARVAPHVPVPRIVGARDGRFVVAASVAGEPCRLQLLTWLDGTPMHQALGGTVQAHDLGQRLGELDAALEDYRPAIPDFSLIWDLTHAESVAPWSSSIADPALRTLVDRAFDAFRDDVLPVADALPRQVIHNDINPHNILVDGDRISGLIDFGDIVEAWRINDLAIAIAYHIGRAGGRELMAALSAGYGSVVRLTPAERRVLPSLVAVRLAMTVAITTRRAAEHPERADYIIRNRPVSIAGLQTLATLPDGSRDIFQGGCE